MKRLRRFFAGPAVPALHLFSGLTEAFIQSRWTVRFFYYVMLFYASENLPAWGQFFLRGQLAMLWPVGWLRWGHFESGIYFLMALSTVGALWGALFPERRWARILAFLGFFEYVALVNSVGKIGHSLHVWVLASFLLIFLPDPAWRRGFVSRIFRQKFLLVVWAVQASLLMTYTMAGFGKVCGAIYQAWIGEVHAFALQAMPLHIADRLLQTGARSGIGEWMIDHPLLCYPMMLGVLYLQLFSFWVAFRPALQRWWAVGLIAFHIMSYVTLTIIFPQNVLLLAMLFFCSPFHLRSATWRDLAERLPVWGDGWHRWRKGRA